MESVWPIVVPSTQPTPLVVPLVGGAWLFHWWVGLGCLENVLWVEVAVRNILNKHHTILSPTTLHHKISILLISTCLSSTQTPLPLHKQNPTHPHTQSSRRGWTGSSVVDFMELCTFKLAITSSPQRNHWYICAFQK